MKLTSALALRKPEDIDGFGQDDFNFNADLLDQAIAPVFNVMAAPFAGGAKGDNVTDDTAALQATLNAAAGVGRVYLPPGKTFAFTQLAVPSNTEIFGGGKLRLIAANPALWPITNSNSGSTGNSNIYLHDFEIDGNAANIAGDPLASGNPAGLIVFTCVDPNLNSNIVVERVYAHDSKRLGIVIQNTQGFAVRDCRVENNLRDGITCYLNCSRGQIVRNRVASCGDDYIALDAEVSGTAGHSLRDVVVAENVLVGPGQGGRGKGITVRGASDVDIVGNLIDAVSDSGIVVFDINTTPAARINILGNVVRGVGASTSGHGILVQAGPASEHGGGTWASITDVHIADNVVTTPTNSGIVLRSDHAAGELSFVTIESNRVVGAGGDGITFATGNIQDVWITDNHVRGTVGAHGIVAASATIKRVFVQNNVVCNGGTYGIRLESIPNGSCVGNVCYDGQAVATQGTGVRLFGLTGTWRVQDNLAFGNTTKNYDDASSATPPHVALAYSNSITPDASAGDSFLIAVTDAVAFTINAPLNPKQGQRITLEIRNTTAGAMGAITWNIVFGLAGAFVVPLAGKSKTISFYYKGTAWMEIARSAADI